MTEVNKYVYVAVHWICIGMSIWFAWAFIFIASRGLQYPFQLEWMEGQSIDVIQRVRDGLPLYAGTSIDYVPFIYTPFYYYITAFVSLFTGVDFFPARLVSILATLGNAAIICAWVRKENSTWENGIIAAGLYLATYIVSGRWFDVSRVDSLSLFFVLSGMFVFFHYSGWRHALLGALLMAAAYFTKQTTAILLAPVLFAALLLYPRHALMTGVPLAIMIGGGILAFSAITHGWFGFYTFTVPAGHSINYGYVKKFWRGDMLPYFRILLLLSAVTCIALLSKNWKKGAVYTALYFGGIACGYMGRLHLYGSFNVLMPTHAILALLGGLSLHVFDHARGHPAVWMGKVLVFVQFINLTYSPYQFAPTKEDAKRGQQFLEQLAQYKGEIFMPNTQHIGKMVGKKSYALGMAAADIFRSELKGKTYIKLKLYAQINNAVTSQKFAAIVPGKFFPMYEKEGLYKLDEYLVYPKLFTTDRAIWVQNKLYIPIENDSGMEFNKEGQTDETAFQPADAPE